MALETATFINQLNPANPSPTDLIGQGDDHIRLLKSVLQETFPNITGAVTLDQDELNGVLAAIAGAGVPTGAITAWYGSSGSVPTGWHVCDGTTGIARSDGTGTIDVPDLRNLVILGAGSLAAQGTPYGSGSSSATTAAAGAHSHSTTAGEGGHAHTGVSVAGHALVVSEIPAHTHTVGVDGGHGSGGSGNTIESGVGSVAGSQNSGSTGSGAAHSHGMSWPGTPDGVHTHSTDAAAAHQHGVTVATYQPALALHYIMKI
jgi:hypothetical protein